jgi:hypothetical protein
LRSSLESCATARLGSLQKDALSIDQVMLAEEAAVSNAEVVHHVDAFVFEQDCPRGLDEP